MASPRTSILTPAAAQPGSTYQRVFADAALVSLLTSAAKLAGGAKVIVTARYFGTSDALDAFLIAFLLPSFVADVIAGSFTPSLVPILVRTQAQEGATAAHRVLRLALGFALGAMAVAAAGLAAAGRWLLPLAGSSFSTEKLQLSTALLLGLLVWLPLSACIATWRAVLNANHSFALAAIAPLASPVLIIALLFGFANQYGVAVLCAGTVGGVMLECVLLSMAVRRKGYPLRPAWQGWRSPELETVRRQYVPLAAAAVISSACVVVDQSVAGRLGSGGVSALVYGNKLAGVLLAIVASAAATAVLPVFSRLAAARDWKGLRRSILVYCGTVALVMTPITIALIASSGFLVRTFFEHGAFHSAATQLVTQVQRFSLLQAPFAMLVAIATRLTAALSANALLVRVGIAALITDVVLDLLFSHWWGVAGIALATPAVQVVSLLVLVWLLARREPELFLAGASR